MSFAEYAKAAAVAARNVIVGGNISSLALIRNPRSMVLYINETRFLFRAFANRRGIAQKNVFDVFPQVRCTEIRMYNSGLETWMHTLPSYTADIMSLCMLCQAIQPKVVFEIGTLTGYTATHMALNSPPDCRVYTLDLLRNDRLSLPATAADVAHVKLNGQRTRYIWEGVAPDGKIQQLWGDSAKFDYSAFHGSVDLFFIDGAHSYEYVRSDTLNALECCHAGSVIVWHDFGRVGVNGVSKWLGEFSRQHDVCSIPGGSLAFHVVS